MNIKTAKKLLNSYLSHDKKRIIHSLAVANTCKNIATRINQIQNTKIDITYVESIGLIHDIGHSKVNYGKPAIHAMEGSLILHQRGFHKEATDIITHSFTPEEAEYYGFNKALFIPKTIDQKILSLADSTTLQDGEITSITKRIDGIVKRYKNTPIEATTLTAKKRLLKIDKELRLLGKISKNYKEIL
jgi:putative nucleotidyltransferase with HDIG domain